MLHQELHALLLDYQMNLSEGTQGDATNQVTNLMFTAFGPDTVTGMGKNGPRVHEMGTTIKCMWRSITWIIPIWWDLYQSVQLILIITLWNNEK